MGLRHMSEREKSIRWEDLNFDCKEAWTCLGVVDGV